MYDTGVAQTRLCTEYAHSHAGPWGMQIPTANALCQGRIWPDGTCASAFRHVRHADGGDDDRA